MLVESKLPRHITRPVAIGKCDRDPTLVIVELLQPFSETKTGSSRFGGRRLSGW